MLSSTTNYIPIETWEKILDEDMNFHTGRTGPNQNIFHNTIDVCLPYLKNKTTALIVGCGYGGPLKRLRQLTDIEFECITNDPEEAEYVRQAIPDAVVHLCSVENFIPTKEYDIAIFIESLSSIRYSLISNATSTSKGLQSIAGCVAEMLVIDSVSKTEEPIFIDDMEMCFATIPQMTDIFNEMGFPIRHKWVANTEDDEWIPLTMLNWLGKINNLTDEEKSIEGIKTLTGAISEVMINRDFFANAMGGCTYHAIKKDV